MQMTQLMLTSSVKCLGNCFGGSNLDLAGKSPCYMEGCGACHINCLSPSCCTVTEYHSLGNLQRTNILAHDSGGWKVQDGAANN